MGISTVVKDRAGRNRYIVFHVEGGQELEVPAVLRALRDAHPPRPERSRLFLVWFEKGMGIVRCPHTHTQEVIQMLRATDRIDSREVRVTTLGTSGTIRKALAKYVEPRLQGRSQP